MRCGGVGGAVFLHLAQDPDERRIVRAIAAFGPVGRVAARPLARDVGHGFGAPRAAAIVLLPPIGAEARAHAIAGRLAQVGQVGARRGHLAFVRSRRRHGPPVTLSRRRSVAPLFRGLHGVGIGHLRLDRLAATQPQDHAVEILRECLDPFIAAHPLEPREMRQQQPVGEAPTLAPVLAVIPHLLLDPVHGVIGELGLGRAARDHQRRIPRASEGGAGPARAVAGLVRHPRPRRRRAHAAGGRQRLEKRDLPLSHELRLRRAGVVGVEIGVEDDGVGCGSVGGGVHRFALLVRKGTGSSIPRGACRTGLPLQHVSPDPIRGGLLHPQAPRAGKPRHGLATDPTVKERHLVAPRCGTGRRSAVSGDDARGARALRPAAPPARRSPAREG